MIDPNFYTKAVFESIYLWQASECRYSQSIQQAVQKPVDSAEFINTFSEFLNNYGVRRNIIGEPDPKSGEKPNATKLWLALRDDLQFFTQLDKEDGSFPSVIDKTAIKLKKKYNKLTRNQLPLSLVSKVAFMYKPDQIPLLDRLAKDAIRSYDKSEKKRPQVNNYQQYFELYSRFTSDQLPKLEEEAATFKDTMDRFPEWKMEDNVSFLARRSVDKLLWWIGKYGE